MSEELVLGLPLAEVEALGRFTGLTTDSDRYWPALLDGSLSFRPRSACETDPSWLQLIPYLVLEHDGRLFHYARSKSGGEARLHARRSIGIGGHINPADGTPAESYRVGLERELAEEVDAPPARGERLLGLVYDPTTPVGAVHLGVVHVVSLTSDRVTPRDPAIAAAGWADAETLKSQIDQFESWSQLTLRAIGVATESQLTDPLVQR